MNQWRIIVRWSRVDRHEVGTFEDTSELPHAVLLGLIRGGARLKLNGCIASGYEPIVDPVARTLEYDVELFPLNPR